MRGSIGDSLLMVVLTISLFFGGMLTLYIMGQINSGMHTKLAAIAEDSTAIDEVYSGLETAKTALGKAVMFIIVAIMAITLALAYLVPAHPLLVALTGIAGALAIILAVAGKSIMDSAFNALPALASQIPGTAWFWNNIAVIMAVYISALMLLMYYGYSQGGLG